MAATSSRPAVAASKFSGILVAFAFCVCLLAAGGQTMAQTRTLPAQDNDCVLQAPDHGCLKVSTPTGSYPIIIDDKPAGFTLPSGRTYSLSPGAHKVEIAFPNDNNWGRGQTINILSRRIHCINLDYAERRVEIPPPPVSPCPYPVNISAPTLERDGNLITFTADASYPGESKLNYIWTVTPQSARITRGGNAPSLEVDSAGLGGNRLTAFLVVSDGSGDPRCTRRAQASTLIEPLPKPEEVSPDEFPSVANDADKARLDYLAIKLQENPTYRAHVVAYGGRTSCPQQADILTTCALRYLVNQRGIDRSRITTVNGGLRDKDTYQLWVLAPGNATPAADPTVAPQDARPSRKCWRRCS